MFIYLWIFMKLYCLENWGEKRGVVVLFCQNILWKFVSIVATFNCSLYHLFLVYWLEIWLLFLKSTEKSTHVSIFMNAISILTSSFQFSWFLIRSKIWYMYNYLYNYNQICQILMYEWIVLLNRKEINLSLLRVFN